MSHFLTITLSALCLWLCGLSPCLAQSTASANLSSRFLARGEKALLEIATPGRSASVISSLPKFQDFELTPTGTSRLRQIPGQPIEFIQEFIVSSYTIGSHAIPALEFSVNGKPFLSSPISFSVFDPNDLTWAQTQAGGKTIRYATTFKTTKSSPFVGENTPVEIKLYFPGDQFVEDWGIPDFERNGLTSWRFQPSLIRGQINLLGTPYYAVSYPSTLTPSRTGEVSIGPVDIRLMTVQVVIDGFQRRVIEEIHVKVPALHLKAKPLPTPAPEGFENAVGHFQLEVNSANTTLQEGDPVIVDMTVSGIGNLDTLRPPTPLITDGWKLYDPSTDARGDERRQAFGSTTFHQYLRPLTQKSEIPPFRFVFFDPDSLCYQTLTSPTIPLTIRPSTNPAVANAQIPSALPVPVEIMADILSLSDRPLRTPTHTFSFQPWMLHTSAILLCLALVLKSLWPKLHAALQPNPHRQLRSTAWKNLKKLKSANDHEFMMRVGSTIETHLSPTTNPELLKILAERDRHCFQAQKSNSFLSPSRRAAILSCLRKSLLSCILFFATFSHLLADESLSSRAKEAYDAANYDQAIALWLSAAPYPDLSADALYNIGNAYYRSGYPGQAALYYRRAIHQNTNHLEARQNLRFLERKYGSITISRSHLIYQLTKIPLQSWQLMAYAFLWLSVISLIAIFSFRNQRAPRILALIGLVTSPTLALTALLAWYFFPNDAEFCPLHQQAVVVSDHAIAYTEASRTSAEVIHVPPGSLCQVISQSGRWSYIALSSQTCGWMPTETIEKILPHSPPTAPSLNKPKPTEKNA